MSRFTTRVELYGSPIYDDYKKLHEAMSKAGFSRQVQLDKTLYWLPNAEYTLEGNQSTIEVKELAKRTAATVWKEYGIMVTRTEVTREFHNLQLVR